MFGDPQPFKQMGAGSRHWAPLWVPTTDKETNFWPAHRALTHGPDLITFNQPYAGLDTYYLPTEKKKLLTI